MSNYHNNPSNPDDMETAINYFRQALARDSLFGKAYTALSLAYMTKHYASTYFQEDFLEQGELAMKPLVLKEVAERIGVHESTVSRATTRKYMLTPRGLFELKYFFSSHVRTERGGMVSATAVKARVQLLIEKEPPETPLSDQEISDLLRSTGILAARRTVAKYRESLGIGSSNERRRLYRRSGAIK